jgi:hypothetical protein
MVNIVEASMGRHQIPAAALGVIKDANTVTLKSA